MTFLSRLRGAVVTEADVRSEVWRLGGRHLGRPLEGAMEELNTPGLSPARAVLLRVCISKLLDDRRKEQGGPACG